VDDSIITHVLLIQTVAVWQFDRQ